MPDPAPAWDATEDGVCALELQLVEPLEWSRIPGEDALELEMPAWGSTSVLRDRVAPILEGLEAGENLPGIVHRLEEAGVYPSRSAARRNARNVVLGLAGQGVVEIHLPPVPEVFGGRYERREELGRGAVGVAWRCRDRERGDDVVVKHAWNWSGSLERRDRNLRDEADLVERLDHPGVVSLVDRLEVGGRFHLVREFVDGRELADRILSEGPLPRPERAPMARHVVGILRHLHERNVWCLDLAPGNLFQRRDGPGVVLADLGHCRRVEAERIDLERVPGTVGYLGPEVFEEHTATRALDVYGLGKLYEFATTGYPPNQGEPVEDVLERMNERGDPTEAEIDLVRACLARQPERRPELSAVLERLEGIESA